MDWQIEFWFLFCLCAVAHLTYAVGKKRGIEMTLDYLKADGQIDFDED